MNLIGYSIFLFLYRLGISITSLWSPKSQLWLKGRRRFPKIDPSSKKIWVHCASLGEFEQARPVIEALKKQHPNIPLVLSFFSPSGFEVRKDYAFADKVIYLPMDGRRNAERLIHDINPMLVIWVKYEYWFHYLKTLNDKKIPTLLISSIFRTSQPFFKPYGSFWRKQLHFFSALFVQDEESSKLLHNIGFRENIFINGDTRFDRVLHLASDRISSENFGFVDEKEKIIVAGSTWKDDEDLLLHFHQTHSDYKMIIVPHEIGDTHVEEILKRFRHSKRYSEWKKNSISEPEKIKVWVVDKIGLLSTLYSISTISYIGGGFNKSGIHNILEAAVWSKPVIFGPNYQKFREAKDLIRMGGAFSVKNPDEWNSIMEIWHEFPEKMKEASEISGVYVRSNGGATERIMDYIYRNRLLTNPSN
ncbi:MAG: hypothetical protein RIR96_1329 [Bacteroidota bacterium]